MAAVESAPHTDWVNIDRPRPAFELQMPEWASTNVNYFILRRARDGSRKDVLTFGDPAANGPYVVFEIYRPGSAGEHFIDAPSEIAARIVAFTVTDDVKAGGPTRQQIRHHVAGRFRHRVGQPFGAPGRRPRQRRSDRTLTVAPLSRLRPAVRGAVHATLRMVLQPGEEVVDRAMLACALDRLTMLTAGGDPALAMLFANAEVKRTFCGQRSPILAATPEHIEPAPVPRTARWAAIKFSVLKLRGSLPIR